MKSSPFTAVFDACVLYPAPLRDFLMWLALSGRFRARWTALIHDEWVRHLLRNRPELDPAQLQRTIDLMNKAVPDALAAYDQQRPLLGVKHPFPLQAFTPSVDRPTETTYIQHR